MHLSQLSLTCTQHLSALPPAEFATLKANLEQMVTDLDRACHHSIDPLDAPMLPVITTTCSGHHGRPSKIINQTFLQYTLKM